MAGTLVLTDTIKKSYDDISGKRIPLDRRSGPLWPGDTTAHSKVLARPRHDPRLDARNARAVKGVQAADPSSSASPSSSATTASCSTPTGTGRSRLLWRGRTRRRSSRWSSSPVTSPTHAGRDHGEPHVEPTRGASTVGETSARESARPARGPTGRRVWRPMAALTAAGARWWPPPPAPLRRCRRDRPLSAVQVVAARASRAGGRIQPGAALNGPHDRGRSPAGQATDKASEATGTALQFVNMSLMTFAIVALSSGRRDLQQVLDRRRAAHQRRRRCSGPSVPSAGR